MAYLLLFLTWFYFRGQESAGIVTSGGSCSKHFNIKKGMGMISTLFNDDAMKKLVGNFFLLYLLRYY